MLVARLGQRFLEAVQAGSAPPAERLLQAMGDEHHTEGDPQQQQAQILGATPSGRLVVLLGVGGGDLHRCRRRMSEISRRLHVGQWLGVVEQAVRGGRRGRTGN